jgi:diguanylate cyclase (GGDEF)-like protein
VLKHVASAIKTRIRREDILSRYGGEEFALLLPEVDVKGAVALAEKIRKLIEKQKFEFDKQEIPVTISAGVAALKNPGAEASDLVRAADAQLYAAKSEGRNKVCAV